MRSLPFLTILGERHEQRDFKFSEDISSDCYQA